jgi:hypothetical protein
VERPSGADDRLPVEEERTMGALLDLLASGVNMFQAQELLAEIIEE